GPTAHEAGREAGTAGGRAAGPAGRRSADPAGRRAAAGYPATLQVCRYFNRPAEELCGRPGRAAREPAGWLLDGPYSPQWRGAWRWRRPFRRWGRGRWPRQA